MLSNYYLWYTSNGNKTFYKNVNQNVLFPSIKTMYTISWKVRFDTINYLKKLFSRMENTFLFKKIRITDLYYF